MAASTSWCGPPVRQTRHFVGHPGRRILYDKTKYKLLTSCPNTSSGGSYSGSCSIKLPIASGESESYRRRAAYAEFRNIASGKRFFFVSAHLSWTSSSNSATLRRFNTLRRDQMATITSRSTPEHRPRTDHRQRHELLVTKYAGNGPRPVQRLRRQRRHRGEPRIRQPTASDHAACPVYIRDEIIDMIFVKGSGCSGFRTDKEVTDCRPSDPGPVYSAWSVASADGPSRCRARLDLFTANVDDMTGLVRQQPSDLRDW